MFNNISGVLILCITFYGLYIYGYLILNRKRVLLFIGTLYGKNNWKADF